MAVSGYHLYIFFTVLIWGFETEAASEHYCHLLPADLGGRFPRVFGDKFGGEFCDKFGDEFSESPNLVMN